MLSVPDVVHRIKTLTTRRYVDGVKHHGWPPFPGILWQRNDYEHIIRDDESLNRIRKYILDNPARWELDREDPNVGRAAHHLASAAWATHGRISQAVPRDERLRRAMARGG